MPKRATMLENNVNQDHQDDDLDGSILDYLDLEPNYGDGAYWSRGPKIREPGSVYLATLNKHKRRRVDNLRPVMAVKSTDVGSRIGLVKERVVLDDLQGSPYIRRIYGVENTVEDYEAYNILLEYPGGGTLVDLMESEGREGLPEDDVWHYARCLLRGLAYFHGRGYVHRNLKVESVILVRSGGGTNDGVSRMVAKIGDYSSVAKIETLRKMMWNRYARMDVDYLSPEACASGLQGPESDIWALGCIVYIMLTGKLKWDGEGASKVEYYLREMRRGNGRVELPDGMSRNAKEFLKACFRRKPKRRLSAEGLLNLPFLSRLS